MDTPDFPELRRSRWGKRWIVGGLVLVLGSAAVWFFFFRAQRTTTTAPATTTVRRETFRQEVATSGIVQPARMATMVFTVAGTVASVDVRVGDQVRAGQVIARLDDTAARLALAQAQADLDQRIAALEATKTISITESDVTQAQANVAIAQAQLQAAQSSAAADTMSGQSNLSLAQTKQETTAQGDVPATVQAARLQTQEAEISLSKTRDSVSAEKTNAQVVLDAATDTLKAAQQKYSDAFWLNDEVQRTGRDPNTLKNKAQPDSGKLTDNQVRAYQQALDAAALAMQQAQDDVQKAQVAYDLARQQEQDAVQQAQQSLDNARQNEATTLAGQVRANLASAQDQVTQNQAALTKQRASNTASVASARGNLLIAQAKLEAAQNPSSPSGSAVASAEAQVAEGEANLFSAQQTVSATLLLAPFAATVSEIDVAPAASVAAGTTALSLIDMSQLATDVELSESDVVNVKPGYAASVQPEALPSAVISGTVQTIAISPTLQYGTASYPVRVALKQVPDSVRLGMTVNVTIITSEHANALIVPIEAVQGSGDKASVQRLVNGTAMTVSVKLGQQNETDTEVLSGVAEGDVLVLPDTESDSSTSTQQSQGGGGGLFGGGNGGGPPPP